MNNDVALNRHAWLLNPHFDLFFIVGVATLALVSGTIVVLKPELFIPVLTADLWLLGYHHVVSTYTRLTFDTESFRQHRNKVIILPILVALAVSAGVIYVGMWLLPTIYLYWQWYHYTRQSEGISKAYAGKSRHKFTGDVRLTRAAFYLIPLAGILHVSARNPDAFLFVAVKTLPVPSWLLVMVDLAAAVAFVMWLVSHVRALQRGELALPYFLYMLSHFSIYYVAYIAIYELNHGWLVINIWHNLQYILFVWLFNNRRFANRIDAKRLFLSTISQSNRFVMYIAVCLTISTFVYYLIGEFGVDAITATLGISSAGAAIIVYQTINFHHYIVDASIWKLRKKKIRANLGIS